LPDNPDQLISWMACRNSSTYKIDSPIAVALVHLAGF
jgi:hypothetical protein